MIWLAWLFCLAGPLTASAQHFSFRQYAQAEGLTNLSTSYLLQSRDTDLWIGTDNGVFRFDGVSFVSFDRRQGLVKEPVRGMAEDPSGRIWIAFDRGLFVGDKKSGFAEVRAAGAPPFADPEMSIVFLSRDRALITLKRKVLELQAIRSATLKPSEPAWKVSPFFTAEQIAATPVLNDARSVFSAPDGTLWVGCGRGLCSLARGETKVWGPREGVPEADWAIVRTDPGGRLWARSATHMVEREPDALKFEVRDAPNGELKSGLTAPVLSFDPQGRVLTRTASGLARWDGQRWQEFTPANGLPNNTITSLIADSSGDLWFSVAGQGIWHWLGYDLLESWTRSEGLEGDNVWGILRDPHGRLVFGTDRGCGTLNGSTARIDPCPFSGMPDLQTVALALDDAGGVWFGLDGASIWRVRPGESVVQPVGSIGTRGAVTQIAFNPSGDGWIDGNGNGLVRVDRDSGKLQKYPLPGDPSRVWESTPMAHNQRCVATIKGLYRLANGHAERMDIDQDGTPAGFSSVVSEPDGGIWAAGLSQGLLHAPGCGAEGAQWIDADIVSKAHIYFVRLDARGWIWAGTDQGVVVFDRNSWQRIDVGDGLIWNDTNATAFYADADGSIWVGTAAGMTHIVDPEGLLARRRRPLDLSIAAASLGDQPIADTGVTRVAWERDASFDLRFASHAHGRSANTEFQYRLLGLSPKWLGSRLPEVHIPALGPGSYRLEARMSDPDHAQQSAVVVSDFVVVPPWWRSVYFYVALATAAGALVIFAWRTQIRRLNARRLAIEAEYKEREALLHRATRDGLTGLWNRSAILEILGREIAQSRRTGQPLMVAMLDVDHFKRINDSFGHLAGDEVLRTLSARVSMALRQSDWIGRYGGEELLAVLPGLTPEEAAAPVERLRECVAEREFDTGVNVIPVTLSIGVSRLGSTFDRMEDLIASADAALYEAKRSGRNRVVHALESAQASTPRLPHVIVEH